MNYSKDFGDVKYLTGSTFVDWLIKLDQASEHQLRSARNVDLDSDDKGVLIAKGGNLKRAEQSVRIFWH